MFQQLRERSFQSSRYCANPDYHELFADQRLKRRGERREERGERSSMDQEEHEVYGQEIPVDGGDIDMDPAEDDAVKMQELDEMKRKLREMEEEAAALREMQSKVEKEMGVVAEPGNADTQAAKEEIDSRSVYVGNVDYACTPEELQQHFQSCGTVNRVTILTDKGGHPKGFAYVEFLELEAVQQAVLLNESELHGRQIKVAPKRTNVPGLKKHRPRRYNPFVDFGYGRPYMPPPYYAPYYGYGRAPRYRRPTRYSPYF
ncbi:Polyadenylate-binding protein 2 [Rhynchospora pubera]|uniref:Polyadenylate-binding protein 2 n=2 Tax=Rhynchospora pubera TaxID=906938 RepID=A0AAV8FB33_9POAL|nr:Polyadenylate-binding protein 2 [Rhynchospora pubera]